MSPLLALRKGNDAHTFLAATSAQTAKASKTLSLPTQAANTDPFGSSPCNFIVNASSECLSMCVCVFKYHDCMLKLLRCVSSYCIYQSYIARWWSIMSKLFFIISKTYYCVFICVPLLGLCTLSTTCLYHTLAQQGLLSSYIDIVGKKLDRADEMMETWSVYGRRISSGSYIHNTC